MIEIPEAYIIAKQIREQLVGKTIDNVIASHSPHKLAWYYKDPSKYDELLSGQTIRGANSFGGFINIKTEHVDLLFADGVNMRYIERGKKHPDKHQLLIKFTDGNKIVCTIKMYGGLWVFPLGRYNELENWLQQSIRSALHKPSPLTENFSFEYFKSVLNNLK